MDLVIGIGNPLRGDDGIGPVVIDAVRARPGLEKVAVQQLLPELAEHLQAFRRVLFVDACLVGEAPTMQRIEPGRHRGLGHACPPDALLGWSLLAYGSAPDGWLLQIPASGFELNAGLSPRIRQWIPRVVEMVEAWLGERSVPGS